ncbi:MAG: UDP-3-O-[3-hydroxymyristoyl] N-acetylglucosamine deacetylase [Lentisphaeria bacterium]|nr:UDP-3-O-[3-hydroxymyristoyl] N-acetylglucosamine deacetylase [Lentisphaeria bacterium]
MEMQQTVAKSAFFSGIALHTGARATIRLQPAPEDIGIVFRRVDLPGSPEVRALASNVVEVQRGTTIADGKAIVYTVEHIMSALHACKVDNCIVEMNGMEPPIADGSSLAFYNLIQEAGIQVQSKAARTFTPDVPVAAVGGKTQVILLPDPEKLSISCVTSFKNCPFDPQFYQYELEQETYAKEIAPGRTFVDYSDLRMLLSVGLCKGGSLDAAAIIHDGAIICKDELRFDNEIVRHKIMDAIGDIYLAGCRITGKLVAVCPGHPKNVELAGKLLAMIQSKQTQE